MQIRLMGLPVEVVAAEHTLREAPGLLVISVDGPYPNRGASSEVRMYLRALLHTDPAVEGRRS